MRYAVAWVLLFSLASCGRAVTKPEVQQAENRPALPHEMPPSRSECAPPGGFDAYRITGPYLHQNLAAFLLHQSEIRRDDLDCLTLEEGLKSGVVKVTEKGEGADVNELQVENTGDKPVYLQAGDTVKGGQQDRSIAVDFILPPKSGKKTVGAFCVEPGRWSARGGLPVATAAIFDIASTQMATKEQKLALRLEKSQDKVWDAGRNANMEMALIAGHSPDKAKDSFVLAVEDPEVRKKADAYVEGLKGILEDKPDAVGMAFAVNGDLSGTEIYATSGLFRKLWPKLLRTCAVEALAKMKDKVETREITQEAVRSLFKEVSDGKGYVEDRSGGTAVRVFDRSRAVLFDTEKDGRLLHRQIIKK